MWMNTILLGLVLISQVDCQDPILKISQTVPKRLFGTDGIAVIEAEQGTDVTMDCQVENVPVGSTVVWQFLPNENSGNSSITPISKDMGVDDNTKHNVESPHTNTWRLRIKKIQKGDIGTYSCHVQLTKNSRQEEKVKIDVLIKPTFIADHVSSDTVAVEGDALSLLCEADGRPKPMIKWTRLGGKVLPGGKEAKFNENILIKNVRKEYEGTYICRAENRIGTIIRKIKLDVEYKPKLVVDTEIFQAVGYLIELQCDIEANPEPSNSQVVWKKDNEALSSNNRMELKIIRGAFHHIRSELIIRSVQKEDYGTYFCQVSNSLDVTRKAVQLKESDVPMISRKVGRVISSADGRVFSILVMFFSCVFTLLMNTRWQH